VITIAPGTYSNSSGFTATTSYPLQIAGAGIGQTTLRAAFANATLGLNWPSGSSVSGLTATGPVQFGIELTGGAAAQVAIEPGAGGSPTWGVGLNNATLKDATISLPASSEAGVVTGAGAAAQNEIDDVKVTGPTYGIYAVGSTTIHRVNVIDSQTSLYVRSAPVYIDDSLLAGGATGIEADDLGGLGEGSVNALNDTIVATRSLQPGVLSHSVTTSGSDIQIANSIVRGFGVSFEAAGTAASVEADHDNFDGLALYGGTHVSNQVGGTPDFVDPAAGDYHLAWNSPLIDAGSDAFVSSQASTSDLDRSAREVPFTHPATPLDLGAYEYQHRAPVAVASATPPSAPAGAAVTFDGSRSSDPDDGDTLSYAWSFDDGAPATGATVTHAFDTPGTHTARLTVTDPTGLTSRQTVTVSVPAPQSTSGGSTPPPGGTTTQPGGGSTPAPGGTTPAPGGTTPAPGGTTPAPGGTTDRLPAGRLTVRSKPVVEGSKIVLKLSCAGSGACTGISVTEMAPRGAVRVAFVALRLNAGQTKAITLTLNGKGKTLLARLGELPVTIKVTNAGAGKTTTVKSARATLHAPKKPRHRDA
jgi:hypothetical protein